MKKRLIALMCAGILVMGAATMTGCEQKDEPDYQIALEYNNQSVLHKGSVEHDVVKPSLDCSGEHKKALPRDVSHMVFECGECVVTNSNYIVSEEKIDEKYYDEICSDCFSEEEIAALEP